jgi:hypothetical protein
MSQSRSSRIPAIIVGVFFLIVLIGLLMPAVKMSRGPSNVAAKNNLKQFGLAMHNYLSAHGAFPPQAICNSRGKPLLSWRVALLPYFESGTFDESLYGQFHLDEPWNSPHNLRLLDKMPAVYSNPRAPEPGRTIYLTAVGDPATFGGAGGSGGRKVQDITDGLSNTIMVVEADMSVPWTKPEDLDYNVDFPMAGLGHAHPGGFIAMLSDGSVRFLLDSIYVDVLRGLMTINGGEPVTVP